MTNVEDITEALRDVIDPENEFERLRAFHGDAVGFRQVGYLLLTGDERRLAALRGGRELQRSLGVATESWGPEQVIARAPFVRS